MGVTFFLPGGAVADALRDLDPDAAPNAFQRGEDAWILQTYIRLKRAGNEVELVESPPENGVVIFHGKHARALLRHRKRMKDVVLVGVRGDLREVSLADIEVLQNGRFADGIRRIFIPHWPQPGLIPRDRRRGATITRVAYKGFSGNLHRAFGSREWVDFLTSLSIAWDIDAARFQGQAMLGHTLAWHDYSTVDLVLAVRPPDRRLHTPKPATKLVNCWRAGVPALLGPEYAYRELRRSELDYIEIASLADAKAAVTRLAVDPGLYRAMVANGERRAAEFTNDEILKHWAALLYETLPSLCESRHGRLARHTPILVRRLVRRLPRLLPWRPAR